MIHILFYANMRTIAGQTNLDIAYAKANTLRKLLSRLIEFIPDIRPYILDKNGNLYQDVPIFVNGRNPRLSGQGMDTPLLSNDVVSLFSPISSGRMNVEVMRVPLIDGQEELE